MIGRTDKKALADVVYWGLFLVLAAASLVPLWVVRVPPMQDIWQHLALVDVIHNFDAPGSIYPDYFVLPDTPKPNLLYYYLTHFLAYATPDLEVANKLVLSLYILGFPPAFLYFLRSFGRSRWLVLFAFPLVYNAMFGYGFVSFLLATPLFFVGIGAYRRFVATPAERPDPAHGTLAALAILATFFTHAHLFLLLGFLGGLLWLMHRRGPWGTAARLWPFLPALVFFVPWFWVYFIERTPSSTGMTFGSFEKFFGPTFYKPSQILGNFFHYVGDYFRGERDDALFIALVLTGLGLMMLRRAPTVPDGEKRKLRYFDLEILTLVLALSVLVLPQHIDAQSIVSLRHILFSVLFLFAWLGFDDAPRRVTIPAVAILVAIDLASVHTTVRGFRDFQREIDRYPHLFDKVDGGKRLLKVAYNQESRTVNYGALWQIHFFYPLLKGGITDFQFAQYPHNPIQYRPDMVPPVTGPDFLHNNAWRYYEYILLRKSSQPNIRGCQDSLDLVSETSDWVLYRVTSSPIPRSSDLAPLASPRRDPFTYDAEAPGATPEAPGAAVPAAVGLTAPAFKGGSHALPDLRTIGHVPVAPGVMRWGRDDAGKPGPRPGRPGPRR